jgi:YihY family inner membrane protein
MQATKVLVRRADRVQRERTALAIALATIKKFGEDRAGQLAALIAYYGFFSLFPLMLAFVTILGLVLEEDSSLRQQLVDSALAQFPIIGDQIKQNIGSLQGSGLALALGVGGALWAGLGGIKAAQNAMDQVWDVPVKRQPSFPVAILRAVIMLVTLGVFVLLAGFLGGIAAGTEDAPVALRVIGIAGTVVLNVLVFLVAFRVLTVEDVSWGDVWPGAMLAAVLWTILQLLGGYIIGHRLESATQTYGFFAVVIGLLSWLYLGAQVTLLGAELNVVRARRLWPRALDPQDMTPADRRALRELAKVEERREDQVVDVRFEGTSEGGNGHAQAPPPPVEVPGRRSTVELIRTIGVDLSTLAKKEVELARQEVMEGVMARAMAAGAFVAAGVLALFVVGFFGLAAAEALDGLMRPWASRLVVAVFFLLLAGIAVLFGKQRAKRPSLTPEETKRTVKEDVAWAKRQLKR